MEYLVSWNLEHLQGLQDDDICHTLSWIPLSEKSTQLRSHSVGDYITPVDPPLCGLFTSLIISTHALICNQWRMTKPNFICI